MIFPDYHLHSEFSSDSEAKLSDIIDSARKQGLTSVCLTDHHDIDFPVEVSEERLDFQLNLPTYKLTLKKLREELAPDFDLRIGVELGVMPSTTEKARNFVKEHSDLDFIIASTHIVDGMDPYYPSYFEGRSDSAGYHRYFEVILDTLRDYTDFDVYGHLDYVVRYGPGQLSTYDPSEHMDVIDEILKIIVQSGHGIEVNTGSLYKGLPMAHPHIDILKRYRALGGEIITIGSDAHIPSRVGAYFDKARSLLLEAGFTSYCTFKKRIPTFHKIS